MKKTYHLLVLLFILGFQPVSLAQTSTEETPKTPVSLKDILTEDSQESEIASDSDLTLDEDVPDDKYRRGQPRSAFQGYLLSAKKQDYTRASHYLDYRNLPEEVKNIGEEELARQLYVVLSRTAWVDLSNISEEAKGNLHEKNVPSYREFLVDIKTKQGSVKLYLQHVPRKDDKVKIWKISNSTVAKIPMLTKEYGYTPLGEWLSKRLPPMSFLGVKLWQWLYFFYMLIVFFLVAKISTYSFTYGLLRFKPNLSEDTQRFIKKPLSLLLTVILVRNLLPEENATHASRAVAEGATLLTIAWLWVLFRLVDLLKIKIGEHFVRQERPLAVYLLRPAGTVIKSIISIVTLLIWFENLGFNATTLIAGLGIGGLAIALAAQKTVENIIGAITLYTSAPVKIGDFCRFGQHLGVVEEIGLRATRIRTIQRTVIYIANAKFIDMEIENFSEREKMAFKPEIYLSPQTRQADLEAFLTALREHFISLENIAETPIRTHFKGYSLKGLVLDVLVYINTTNFNVYLDEINQINLTILSLLEEHNCQLQVVNDNRML